jgi:hypothetical protein
VSLATNKKVKGFDHIFDSFKAIDLQMGANKKNSSTNFRDFECEKNVSKSFKL